MLLLSLNTLVVPEDKKKKKIKCQLSSCCHSELLALSILMKITYANRRKVGKIGALMNLSNRKVFPKGLI